jgi:hypothetical protein
VKEQVMHPLHQHQVSDAGTITIFLALYNNGKTILNGFINGCEDKVFVGFTDF